MSKFQPVNYKSVADLLAQLPKDEHKVLMYLRSLIFECIPNVSEKLSYNVPYYSLNKRIVYVWPSHVPWGKVKLHGVSLGFVNGYLLGDTEGYLDKGKRKQVYTKTFISISEIDEGIVKMFLFKAAKIDASK